MRQYGQWMIACAVAAQLLGLAADSPRPQPRDAADNATAAAPLPWAKPLHGGPLRIAAVFPLDGAADFDALVAAFDLRASLFPFGAGAQPAGDALDEALKSKADALVLSALPLTQISETARQSLAARVKNGLGLLWIAYSTEGDAELKDFLSDAGLVPLDPSPDFAARAGGATLSGLQPGLDQTFAYSSEKSRAVQLRFWKPRPRGHALLPLAASDALDAPAAYQNYIAIACDALRWAARREPDLAISGIEDVAPVGPKDVDTPPQLPVTYVKRMREAAQPGVLRPFTIKLDRPAPRNYALRIQARYTNRPIRWFYNAEEVVHKNARETTVNIPVGAGPCFLDAWLMDGPQVIDWFTQPLNLPASPDLGEVTFSAPAVDANDRLRVSVDVHRDLLRGDLARPQPATVYLRVTDAIGRVVAAKDIAIPDSGGQIAQELALVDIFSPYARADIFAASVVNSPLTWWIREHAQHRSEHLSVRHPVPAGLALIVDEAGEGSFAGAVRRRQWTAKGVDFIFPGAEPDLGNVAADGLRAIARLGDTAAFPGADFGARSRPGIALRQAASRYAAARPGLYVVALASGTSPAPDAEKSRAAIERVVRETDPKAAVAWLDGEFSATGTGGFLVLPADPEILEAAPRTSAAYVALRAPLPTDDHAAARSRWLPWLAAIFQSNALWLSSTDQNADDGVLTEIISESNRVRAGFDVLLLRAIPSPLTEDPTLKLPKNFSGVAKRFTLGDAIIYAFLLDPAAPSKAAIKLSAGDAKARIYIPTAALPTASRGATAKLQAGDAALAVLLPYEVSRIAIEVPTSIDAGRRLNIRAAIKTKGALPGEHVLRVTCFGPRGEPLPHYSRSVFAPAGSGSTWIPLAFNDPPGAYRIVVRDVLSGVESQVSVNVLASPEIEPAYLR